jgi:hypothetical protein
MRVKGEARVEVIRDPASCLVSSWKGQRNLCRDRRNVAENHASLVLQYY